MRALRFNLQNRARVIKSLEVFENLYVEVSESECHGLTFTVECVGDCRSFNDVILSKIPCNWSYSIYVKYDYDFDRYCPVLFCYEKSV